MDSFGSWLRMADATATGERVLAGLAEGRRRAIEQRQKYSRFLAALVMEAASRDRGPERGKAKRIESVLTIVTYQSGRKVVKRLVTERCIRNILARQKYFGTTLSGSDSMVNTPVQSNGEAA